MKKFDLEKTVVGIVGLGYVGLPLAEAFSRSLRVIGFDINSDRIKKLRQSHRKRSLILTDNPEELKKADFIIICVPTPVTPSKEPDLCPVTSAAQIAGQNLKKGSTVILESTVFPGVTEDMVRPILEKESGLKCGRDFKIGYSPERVNPGDSQHEIGEIIKVVSGMDTETTERMTQLYSLVTRVFVARDIKTAEAAKVIENVQRDLNIALMNELSLIFERMGLCTQNVLDAASTKWNFHPYAPGLVGGHCIPVDPYYLVYKARELGYHSQVILAGRAINDFMPKHVAEMTIKGLNTVGKVIKGSRVLVMGLTYKENVPDTRETPVKEIIHELKEFEVEVYGYDPLLDDIKNEFAIEVVRSLKKTVPFDAIIMAVAHDEFRKIKLTELKKIMKEKPVFIDVRQAFRRAEAEKKGFYYRTL